MKRTALLLACLGAAAGCGAPSGLCPEGYRRCNGAVLDHCRDGDWQLLEDCAAVQENCVDDPAGARCEQRPVLCREGVQRCNGSVVEDCHQGAWQPGQDCAASGELCRYRPDDQTAACQQPLQCSEGATRCHGDIIQSCSAGFWVGQRDCTQEGKVCRQEGDSEPADCLDPPCAEGTTRCRAGLLEQCQDGVFQQLEDCRLRPGWCDVSAGTAACRELAWQHLEVFIDDPIMQGNSLVLPVDGPSFGLDPASGALASAFTRDYDDPRVSYLWLLEPGGRHWRRQLGGEVFPAGENFCAGGEDWCQFISFDAVSAEWLVTGPSASAIMRVGADGQARLAATAGERQPDAFIERTFFFDWLARRLYLYGAIGPISFSSALYALDLDGGGWQRLVGGLDPVAGNCLVVAGGRAWSFAGLTTSDGGGTSYPLESFGEIDLLTGARQQYALPDELAERQGLACAWDGSRQLVYLFGGAVVRDHFNEIANDYFNDLWAFDPASGEFRLLAAPTPPGTFDPPDSYGDRRFTADPQRPNFGQNRGHLLYDGARDRLLVVGEVPQTYHGQAYIMELAGVDYLLAP